MASFSVFDSYVEEVDDLLRQAEAKVAECGGDAKAEVSLLHDAQLLCEQADGAIAQMDIEVRSSPRDGRPALTERKKKCAGRISATRRRIEEARADLQRRDLLGGGPGGSGAGAAGGAAVGAASLQQRQRMLDANGQLASQNETREQARRVLMDTEDAGLDIMAQLAENREKIGTAHGRVKDELGMLQNANGLVTRMSKWWNRW